MFEHLVKHQVEIYQAIKTNWKTWCKPRLSRVNWTGERERENKLVIILAHQKLAPFPRPIHYGPGTITDLATACVTCVE